MYQQHSHSDLFKPLYIERKLIKIEEQMEVRSFKGITQIYCTMIPTVHAPKVYMELAKNKIQLNRCILL